MFNVNLFILKIENQEKNWKLHEHPNEENYLLHVLNCLIDFKYFGSINQQKDMIIIANVPN